MSDFNVQILDTDKQNVKIVNLTGELDESVLDIFKEKIDGILNDINISIIIFNLEGLEFMNSKGIGFIVSIHTHLTKDARKMILTNATEAVMDVISLVGLTSIIEYYNTKEEALSSL